MEKWIPISVTVAGFIGISLSSFLPDSRLWGINHLAFHAVPVRVAALGLVALTFVPRIAGCVHRTLLRVVSAISTARSRAGAFILPASLLSLCLFVGLRASTLLLGDGQLIAQSFETAHEGGSVLVMRSAGAILTEERIAPGATLLYYAAGKVATGISGGSPVSGIRLVNCVLGAVLVFILFRIVQRFPVSPSIRLWMLVLAAFSGATQLYFGYVEYYPPLLFFTTLFVIGGMRALRCRAGVWTAVALLVISIFVHLEGLLLLPAGIFLIVWRLIRDRRPVPSEAIAVAALALAGIAVAGAAIAGVVPPLGRHLLPLSAAGGAPSLSLGSHWLDVLNELLLLMPALPLVLALAAAGGTHGRRPAAKPDAEWLTRRVEWLFCLLLLAPCLAYLIGFKSDIGRARDWDLFAVTAPGLVLLSLLILNRHSRSRPSAFLPPMVTVPTLVMTLLLGSAWIGINGSPTKSVVRFRTTLGYDRTHESYAYRNLATHFHANGDLPEAMRMMERAMAVLWRPQDGVRLASYYEESGDLRRAIDLLKAVLTRMPDHEAARDRLLSLLHGAGRFDEVEAVAREGIAHHPIKGQYYFYLGEALLRAGRRDEGRAALRDCLDLNPPRAVRDWVLALMRQSAGGD